MSSRRVAFLFPGQGSQHVGMGKDFYDHVPIAREIYEQANETLGWDVAKMSFEGPKEDLTLTCHTQPAIMVHSFVAMTLLREKGIEPAIALGHSLGEYSALLAAGSVSFQTALHLVKERGKFMHEAVPEGGGAMAALIGMDREAVETICAEVEGVVEVANYNGPGQTVISGAREAVDAAVKLAEERGVRKAVMLPVGAPFHCSLLTDAAERMSKVLDSVEIADPAIPVYSNVTGKPIRTGEEARQMLKKQVRAAVRWEDAVRAAAGDRVDSFVEVGPGKVLVGLNRRITRETPVFNVEDRQSLESALSGLMSVA